MRVLLTTDTVGGVWTFTRELTGELLRAGHDIFLVSFGRRPSEEHYSWCEKTQRRYLTHFRYIGSEVPLEWMSNNERVYEAGEELLLEIAEDFKPDLVHSNQYCFGALPLDVSKLVTAHSDVLSWAEACRPTGLDATPWLARYLRYVEAGLAGADMIVAPTHWMLDALKRSFSIPKQAEVVLNGRSLAKERATKPKIMRAVTVGRLWDEAKNVRILREVKASIPLLIAGEEGLQDMENQRELCSWKREGLYSLGALSEYEVLRLFRSSSIYIATSIYEPFGLAPLEAALCGCAVVANDIASLREVWGDAALYFSGVSSLEQILGTLTTQPSLLREAQLRARRRAGQLTSSKMARAYESLYRQMILNSDHSRVQATTCPKRLKESISHAS